MRPQEAIRPMDPERVACRLAGRPAVVRVRAGAVSVLAALEEVAALAAAAAEEEPAAAGGEDAEGLATATAIRLSSGTGGRITTGSPVPCFTESAIQRSTRGHFRSMACLSPKRPTLKIISDSALADRCSSPSC